MTHADHPAAMQLRAMNIIYEMTKGRGATILILTSMVDGMKSRDGASVGRTGNRIAKGEWAPLRTPGRRVSRHLARSTDANHRRACKASADAVSIVFLEPGRGSGRKCPID